MTDHALNALPAWGTVVRQQLRMLLLLQRRDFLVLAALALALLVLSVVALVRIEDAAAGTAQDFAPGAIPVLLVLVVPLALVAALWPTGVWRDDTPAQRGYFWALPVARGPHTLVRTVLGWAVLMGVCGGAMLLTAIVAQVYSARIDGFVPSYESWYIPLAAATLVYTLVSVPAVLTNGPIRWVLWVLIGFVGLRLVSTATGLVGVAALLAEVADSFSLAVWGPLTGPRFAIATWAAHYVSWLAAGCAVLVAGAFRHRDW